MFEVEKNTRHFITTRQSALPVALNSCGYTEIVTAFVLRDSVYPLIKVVFKANPAGEWLMFG